MTKKSYASNPNDILELINSIRTQANLPEIIQLDEIAKYAKTLSSNKPMKWKDTGSYVSISNMNFTELLNEKLPSNHLVSSWMNSPSRTPVIYAPGKYGAVVFSEYKGNTYVSVVVMSFFH